VVISRRSLEAAHSTLLSIQRRRLQAAVTCAAAHARDVWEWAAGGEGRRVVGLVAARDAWANRI
jgi:hypothetical protein